MTEVGKISVFIRGIVLAAAFAMVFHICALGTGLESEAGDEPPASGKERVYAAMNDVDSLRRLASHSMKVGDFDDLIAIARRMRYIGDRRNDDEIRLSGMLYTIHGMLASNRIDSIEGYFEQARSLCRKTDNPKALVSLYSDMGIYAVNVKMDYYEGVSYFVDGLKLAEEIGDERKSSMLCCNLAITYNLRNDPAGLEYALKAYEYGVANGDRYLIFTGAYLSAFMYELLHDCQTALGYSRQALSMVDEFRDKTGVYDLHANILLCLGREDEARIYFAKAMEHAEEGEAISVTNAYLNYGRYLLGKGRNNDAVATLRKGLEVSERKNNPVYRYKLYLSLSEAYESMADYRRALEYHKIFHGQSDSVFYVERERSINQLRIQYEAEKRERELQQHKLEILRAEKRLHISTLVIVLILMILGATYIQYYRKNKNYLNILRQNQEGKNKERWYREQIEKLSGNSPETGYADKYSVSSLTDEKGEKLFRELENLVKGEHIYRDPEMSRDKVAEMLSTNRTYLSQVINAHTGLSYNYYMNSFRVDEAVRVLSDPDNDTPLKALFSELGFSSLSTFYKLFQAAMGMPPSRYREMVREKNRQNPDSEP